MSNTPTLKLLNGGGGQPDSPVSNFETNVGSSRRDLPLRSRQHQASPPERLKRRVLDIEDALIWAFRDELPKGGRDQGGLRSPDFPSTSPMFSMVAFGVRIDNWSQEPGFPLALGEPHPDAVRIGGAVDRLEHFAEQPIETGLDLGAGLAALGVDEEAAMRKALRGVVATIARCAKLGRRPYWTREITPEPVRAGNGAPLVARWETLETKKLGGGYAAEEVLAPVEVRQRGVYPDGAHCLLRFSPDPTIVANERAEYAAWWAALNWMAEELAGTLQTIAIIPPGAAQRPWLGEGEQAKPPRVFDDLSAPVYRNQARETAAAYRALGARRSFGRRGQAAQSPLRRAQVRDAAVG